ncbi:hypothetical protein EYF80_014514 [Liparis tanakae]|uniref:Uncharacterized protein n=1 Tax=Liparis tanakae TaxID=230148 RepID=A0A4Z2IBE0_9TELE|nr:hypothetical protein EYF80_014514 [Liparis tanakae]
MEKGSEGETLQGKGKFSYEQGLAVVVQVGVVLVVQWHRHWDVYSIRLLVVLLEIVPHQLHCDCLWRTIRNQLGRHLAPFGFISPVLKPDFHLGLGEFQSFCQIGPFRT